MSSTKTHRRSALAVVHLLFSAVLFVAATTATAQVDAATIYTLNPIVCDGYTVTGQFTSGIIYGLFTSSGSGTTLYGTTTTYPNPSPINFLTITNPTLNINDTVFGTGQPEIIGYAPNDSVINSEFTNTTFNVNDSPNVEVILAMNGDGQNITITWGQSNVLQLAIYDGVSHQSFGSALPSPDADGYWEVATVVPEPGTLTLLGLALLGLAGVVYLRRRRAKA